MNARPEGRWWLTDAALAGGMLVLEIAVLRLFGGRAAAWPIQAGTLPMMIVGCGLLVWRRRFPVPVLAVEAVLVLIQALLHRPLLTVPAMLLAVLTVAATGWRGTSVAAGVAALTLIAGPAVTRPIAPLGLVAVLACCVATLSTGLYLDAAQGRRTEARERLARLEHERQLRAEGAVTHERLRIARELHDVVAHHLSLVVLQSAAARTMLPGDALALPAVQASETAARRALDEMRRMVGVLRLGDLSVTAERSPLPTLNDLPALVDHAQSAGLPVTVQIDGHLDDLPDGIDLCAYRIIQEGITNVIRHAPAAPTTITVRRSTNHLSLVVDNHASQHHTAPLTDTHGMGLLGMTERVAVLGGRLHAGPKSAGGWTVHADIPLPVRPA